MTIRIEGMLNRGDLTLRLDLEIAAGLTAIVGPNGSGKTTLLRLIAGLEQLDEGTLHIDGALVDDAGSTFSAAHQRSMSVVFQEPRLSPHARVVDNVAFPLRRRGLSRPQASARASTTLGLVEMSEQAHRRPRQLSGGQRQRVAIARALVAESEILLLDEPLASIDDNGRATIRRLLMNAPARTVLWVSHNPADTLDATCQITFANGCVSQTSSL